MEKRSRAAVRKVSTYVCSSQIRGSVRPSVRPSPGVRRD